MAVMSEYMQYRGWMLQYLKYLHWYAFFYQKPFGRLEEFVDAPVYIRTWYSPKVDVATYRFGVLFRIYDWSDDLQRNESSSVHHKLFW